MELKLGYAIHFVADMDRAVSFYRDTLGLKLKFAAPGWTEFATGETTLALHPASPRAAGSTHPGSARRIQCVSQCDDRGRYPLHTGSGTIAWRYARRICRFRRGAVQRQRLTAASRPCAA